MRIELTEDQIKQLEPLFQKAKDTYLEGFAKNLAGRDTRGVLFAQIQSYPKGVMDVVFLKYPLSENVVGLCNQNLGLIVKK